MMEIWEDISVKIQGKSFSLINTEIEKRVIIQYIVTQKKTDLEEKCKGAGIKISANDEVIEVECEKEIKSDEYVQKLLGQVLQLIGEIVSLYEAKKACTELRPRQTEEKTTKSAFRGAQAPKPTSSSSQAQAPVLDLGQTLVHVPAGAKTGNVFFDPSRSETWVVTARPTSRSSRLKWLIPVGVGLVAAVAAPVVIPAAVGALGFGTGGIVGGSIAASMMSASAIANGGGVVAGGLVATLQSIGATGAISATAALATGGAAAAVSGGIVAATSPNDSD